MSAGIRFREAIDDYEARLRTEVPADRAGAILALLRQRDRLPWGRVAEQAPNLVTGHHLLDPGGGKALQLCLEAPDADDAGQTLALDRLDAWAVGFLDRCASLALAEVVYAHVETGFMRLVDDGHDAFDAWIATKLPPPGWRERADIDWWAASLARKHQPGIDLAGGAIGQSRSDHVAAYRWLADAYLKMMAWQIPYPTDTELGGCSIQSYQDILAWLIAWAIGDRSLEQGQPAVNEQILADGIARDLGLEPNVACESLSAFALDRVNAAWHAAVPGIAAAPLIRVAPGHVILSRYGLTGEPLLFLLRELRRREPEAYHNAAHHRETQFREDLYALFGDRRFVTSPRRLILRREGGTIRTDIDAAVFDRKTGALALFELKSQEPFARSTAEQARQRDNLLFANRQLSGVLDWVKRYGADELLGRIDSRTARSFRVRKVVPFVLGRYLAHFSEGPTPDRRAAWGTWPELLRLLDGQTVRATETNPIASLHARLANQPSPIQVPADGPPLVISLGSARVVVHASWAAYRGT